VKKLLLGISLVLSVGLVHASDPNWSLNSSYDSESNKILISWDISAESLEVAKIVGVVVKDKNGVTIAEKKTGLDQMPKKINVAPLNSGSHEVKFYYQDQSNNWFNIIRNLSVDFQKNNAPEVDHTGAVTPGGTIEIVGKGSYSSEPEPQIVSVSWVSGAIIEKVEYPDRDSISPMPGLIHVKLANGLEESVTIKVLFDNSTTKLITIPVIQPVQPSNEGNVKIQCDLVSYTGEPKGNFQYSYDGSTVDYIADTKFFGDPGYYYYVTNNLYSVTDKITSFSLNSDIMFGYTPMAPTTASPQRSIYQFERSPSMFVSRWIPGYGEGFIDLERGIYQDNQGGAGTFSCHPMNGAYYDLETERQSLYSEIQRSTLFDSQYTVLNQYAHDAKNKNDIDWSRNQLIEAQSYSKQVMDLRALRLQELNDVSMDLSDKTRIQKIIANAETLESLYVIPDEIQRAHQVWLKAQSDPKPTTTSSSNPEVPDEPSPSPTTSSSDPEAQGEPNPKPITSSSNPESQGGSSPVPTTPSSNPEAQSESNPTLATSNSNPEAQNESDSNSGAQTEPNPKPTEVTLVTYQCKFYDEEQSGKIVGTGSIQLEQPSSRITNLDVMISHTLLGHTFPSKYDIDDLQEYANSGNFSLGNRQGHKMYTFNLALTDNNEHIIGRYENSIYIEGSVNSVYSGELRCRYLPQIKPNHSSLSALVAKSGGGSVGWLALWGLLIVRNLKSKTTSN
jgi:hypothetical protein